MPGVAAQPKMPSAAAQPSTPVRISPPISAGPGSYRLVAGAGGRQVGSVMVHARDKGAVEVTDLGVDQTQRGHGIGQMLVASAAKTGLQFGKSKVTLAAQDNGSGHLTRWYKGMGFAQTGVNRHGYPELEAPIGRVLAGAAQPMLLALPKKSAIARCACGCSPSRIAQPSRKQRQIKDYKVGKIGNRAATVKVPSGEEESLLDDCFRADPPPPYTTWMQYLKENPMDQETLIRFCQKHLGRAF
jgi:ribosomal protein S18 acetylase RimI-like enzyme